MDFTGTGVERNNLEFSGKKKSVVCNSALSADTKEIMGNTFGGLKTRRN